MGSRVAIVFAGVFTLAFLACELAPKPKSDPFGRYGEPTETKVADSKAAAKKGSASDRDGPRIEAERSLATSQATVELRGRVTDDSEVADLSVDGASLDLQDDGSFRLRRGVPIGESTLTLVAVDAWGNESTHEVTVSRSGQTARSELAETLPTTLEFGRYHALVIGNNAYTDLPRLETAVFDAEAVSKLLEREYGFEVTLLKDATRSQILSALSSYRRTLSEQDNLLIYYAGHGWNDEDADEAYWLPVNATKNEQTEWISNATLSQMLRAMAARHVIIVADSCYSGTLTRGIKMQRSQPGWLERLASRRSRTALTSGGNEPVVDGGPDGHSVFAGAFLAALGANEGVVDATELHSDLRRRVMLGADQTPLYGDIRKAGHDDGDFLFVRKPN